MKKNTSMSYNAFTVIQRLIFQAKEKLAFTLAETLITLGIIGIVATLTLPTLITNYKRKQLQTQFNSTYAIINQALKLTMNDLEIESSSDFATYYFKNKDNLKQDFVEINKIWESKFQGATKINKQVFPNNKEFKQYDFWGNSWSYNYYSNYDNTFLLPNGAQISYLDYDGNVNYQSTIALVIFFDTNGPYKGPNRTGYDLFYYYDAGKYLTATCTPLATPVNGYWKTIQYAACSNYAMKNINPYDKSKKYWDGLYKPRSWWEKLEKESK